MTHDSRSFLDTLKVSSLSAIIMSVATDIGSYTARLAERRRQRRDLARLDHRLLKDIGLSVDAALDELHRPFWR